MLEQEADFPEFHLAIMFPDSEFSLLDSIEKKIKVVTAVARELDLKNVIPVRKRAEEEKGKYHFVSEQGSTEFPQFVKLVSGKILKNGSNSLANGIFYLKGGDLDNELYAFRRKVRVWEYKRFLQ